jgi:hypothetical protein
VEVPEAAAAAYSLFKRWTTFDKSRMKEKLQIIVGSSKQEEEMDAGL